MNYDKFGQAYTTTDDLCDLLYQNPELDLSKFLVEDWDRYNTAVKQTYADLPLVNEYHALPADYDAAVFHRTLQEQWHMPQEYLELDIAEWVLSKCTTDPELQRVGQELLLFQERDLFNLLRWLKYFVDTMRNNNIVWGVGRGSSVASYVLYLIGVHRINSMYYDLDIEEFLK
jgi:DNA polymerase III alpha subunit